MSSNVSKCKFFYVSKEVVDKPSVKFSEFLVTINYIILRVPHKSETTLT